MTNTILVPLDGSPLAERALPPAVAIARRGGGRLVLVRAVPFLSRPQDERAFPTLAAAREAAIAEARGYLDGHVARLASYGVAATAELTEENEAMGISAVAGQIGATLVAMTTLGARAWGAGSMAASSSNCCAISPRRSCWCAAGTAHRPISRSTPARRSSCRSMAPASPRKP